MWNKIRLPEEYLKARSDDPTFKRWAQCMKEPAAAQGATNSVSIRGYANDAGVAANLGRLGSAKGPAQFRKLFYRMVSTCDVTLVDMGDFVSGASTAQCHKWVRENTPKENHSLVCSVGGGHDWAAVDFDVPDIQIIHIDTHLDVRPYAPTALHSGMPFRYLIEQGASVWCMGAQEEYHSPEQWAYAQSNFKGLLSLDALEKDFSHAIDHCFSAIDAQKPLGLSIDLDAFPQGVSPGVSAPSPRGISVEHVTKIIDAVAKNLNIVGFYELNPTYDVDDQSARLAGYLMSRILMKKYSS